MKSNIRILVLLAVMLPLLLMQSCSEKQQPDPFEDNLFLVSSKVEFMRTKENMVTLLNYGAILYPEIAGLIPEVKTGVNIYSITYNTTFMGEDVLASGLIMVPSVPGAYPVLSYQNGTNTLNANAPSVDPDYQAYQFLQCVASTGYVVVLADYLGFGVSHDMAHPYIHKESTVQTLVDMLYSLDEFDKDIAKDITVSDEYFLLGYSQGGWATLALLDALENDFSADFTVKAASCGAGPYDLNYFNSHVLTLAEYPMPVFLGYISNAYSEYDLYANPLTDLYNDPYAGRIPGLYDGMHTSEQINDQLIRSIPALFKAAYISGYSTSAAYQGVRDALTANSIQGWHTSIPLLFTHGTADDYVFPVLSERMHDAMLDAGTNPLTCLYVPMQDLDHSDGAVPAGLAGLEFFKAYR
jgi:pimeloyl-ACP methyl ester carboxylesterase